MDDGPTRPRTDSSGAFVIAIAAGPFLLPVLGVDLRDLAFAVPMLATLCGALTCAAAARRRPERRMLWWCLAAANSIACAASALVIASTLAGAPETLGLYMGLAASIAITLCGLEIARSAMRERGVLGAVDPLLSAGVPVALAAYLVVGPVMRHGDPLLGTVLLVDLAAFLLASLCAVSSLPRDTKGALLLAFTVVAAGDGVAAASSAGLAAQAPWLVAMLWAAGGLAFAAAAQADGKEDAAVADASEESLRRAYGRALLPLAAVLAYPAVAISLGVLTSSPAPVATFGTLFLVSMVVAFGRQAHLVVANHRAAARERRLRAEAQRRTRELEALTAVAATMTETLEEGPMIERGLDALRVAARTSSSALHLLDEGRPSLRAATGSWASEAVWAPPPADASQLSSSMRGGRHIARLPVVARGRHLGFVTLVRPQTDVAFDDELDLLRLLVDQLAIALQNARDYCEKLDLATRDPLTGTFNRRYFVDAFEKEIARHRRYGSEAALAMFDIDDFKSINDSLGHAAGDEVLREVCRLVMPIIRPADTFARTGGEEFWLLLPETTQLDALLVAERIRTAVARQRILDGRQVTLSGGIAALGQDGHTREDVEGSADRALYWAKRNGKNMCAVSSEAIAGTMPDVPSGMLAHLHAVVAGMDAESVDTRDHSENVAAYAVAIGQAIGLDSERIVKVRRAALLHDIGKVGVPDAILSKPSGLTDEEDAQVRIHPEVGATMLAHAGMREESAWVRHHHERFDGHGYPDGLAGDDIPLEARILFVADAFEAMTSDRPYHHPITVADALIELQACAGTQFDARLVEALDRLVRDGDVAVLALRDVT